MKIQALIHSLRTWTSGTGSLQQKLAAGLMRSIRRGDIAPGMKLPSERAMAQSLRISRTTVVGAYGLLRESGWLESRSGSGTWVSHASPLVAAARGDAHLAALSASPLLSLMADHEEDGLIDFALGTPLPLTALPMEVFTLPLDHYAALLRDPRYYPLGLPSLREAIARYFSALGLDTSASQILVTNGAQHAIALCTAAYLQRGDSALIEDPAYFGALDAFRTAGARVYSLPVTKSGVLPSVLRDRITATAARLVYLTPTYQNPTGVVIPAAARSEMSRLAVEFGVPIIDDCTFADLRLEGSACAPLAAYSREANVITIGSLSKLVWPGLRVGWIRAAEPVIERLAHCRSVCDLGSALMPQAIAVQVLEALDLARKLRRDELKPRRDLLVSLLRRNLTSWSFQVPSGGLFLWAEVPSGDSRHFSQLALRHGIITLPGPIMSATESHSKRLRLPFFAEPHTLKEGVARLSAAWRRYRADDDRKLYKQSTVV